MRRVGQLVTDARGVLRAADAAGVGVSRSTRQSLVGSGRVIRPFRGVYVAAGAVGEDTPLRAALTQLGDPAVAVLGSAAQVHGLAGLPLGWVPQVAVPPGLERAQREGMEIHVWDLPAHQVEAIDGMRVTSVLRTLADSCRLLDREQAVALVDSALHQGLITTDRFTDVLNLMARRRSCVAGRRALGLARVGAQSPGETRVRLILSDAGLPPDRLQVEIRSEAGVLLGIGDLGYDLPDGSLLVIEFDGRSVHDLPTAVLNDRRRQNSMLAQREVTMLRFAWEDTYSPRAIPAVVRPILSEAGWRPRSSTTRRP